MKERLLYAVADPDRVCDPEPEPYNADLLLGAYPAWQTYTVPLNGNYAGMFEFTP